MLLFAVLTLLVLPTSEVVLGGLFTHWQLNIAAVIAQLGVINVFIFSDTHPFALGK